MAHPYREKPPVVPPPLRDTPARLDVASVTFGFCCAVLGLALAGPRYAPAITLGGTFLVLTAPRRQS
jgi:hypothetical protein